ncbi:MAG: chemotaxis response regulator protein-glutamate methylesterase [Desulfuromonadaceae bacterium]|nr:chemotaxis response regulator protein-glutamate methylesterase [Desulfuromonadaceae bacterium]
MSLRVVVADDSALFRRVLSDVLSALPEVEVVGSAPNGALAVKKVRELQPDLLTLDLEMPEMDGLGVLEQLAKEGIEVSVLVVSAKTSHGSQLTLQALGKGAFDFITKPEGLSAEESRDHIRAKLTPLVRTLASRLSIKKILKQQIARPAAAADSSRSATSAATAIAVTSTPPITTTRAVPPSSPVKLVLIGVSTGGPAALTQLLPTLPPDLGVPVLIVQHMPEKFTRSLAENLDGRCALGVHEAVDGETIEANQMYIAPGGRQMKIEPGPNGSRIVRITDDPPENNCKPAVDYLFRSVASQFPGQAMAVILTGMGSDGTIGVRLLRRHGCFTIAQDEASCVVYGMPKCVVEAGCADAVLPLDQIGRRIVSAVRGRFL